MISSSAAGRLLLAAWSIAVLAFLIAPIVVICNATIWMRLARRSG